MSPLPPNIIYPTISFRAPRESDLPTGYPLTTHVTPVMLDHCRACTKVPAVYSIVGDMRLGESPCVLCAPCWRNMGPSKDPDDVLVVPLVEHKYGWIKNS